MRGIILSNEVYDKPVSAKAGWEGSFKTRCKYIHVRSLRPSLGTTLRAAGAVQIVCPDELSLPAIHGFQRVLTNLPGADLDARRAPVGGAPGMVHIKIPSQPANVPLVLIWPYEEILPHRAHTGSRCYPGVPGRQGWWIGYG